jgi:4-amino-4-deoxy-L-arabinose transferase-like glycosyltransferase
MDGGSNQLRINLGFLGPRLDKSFLHATALVVVSTLLFFGRSGCPLQEPEEPRYAEIARQMLEKGNLVVPVLHGLAYYDKPPLLYWLIMGCYALFGVHDWAARLVSCGAGFLSVWLTYFWGKQTVGPRAAFAGAMILCLSGRFVYLGRLVTMNSLLCLCVVAALAFAHRALSGPSIRWGWWLLSAAACALGLLTKGPVALALVAAPVLAFQIVDRRTPRPRLSHWLAYLALTVGLASPWYLMLTAHDPHFLSYFFWRHNLLRYVAPFDHAKPWWFYLPELAVGMLPWPLLLIPLLIHLRRSTQPRAQQPAALGFFLLAASWCLVFYSIAGSKRAGYILPAMPPLALVFGCYLGGALARLPGPSRRRATVSWVCSGAAVFAGLLIGLHLVLPGYARKFSLRGQVRPLAKLVQNPEIQVICYPRGWDSVGFYLHRDDVRVYTPNERPQLVADLKTKPQTLAFIKSDHSLDEFLQDLRGSMEFIPQGRAGDVTAGWVCPKSDRRQLVKQFRDDRSPAIRWPL